ncbi:hypothetical protein EJB05_37752, partial [Eragrostis curvula]
LRPHPAPPAAVAAASRTTRVAAAAEAAPLAAEAASRAARSAGAAESHAARLSSRCCALSIHFAPPRYRTFDDFRRVCYVPGKDVTEEDVASDEAIWALYERWCKAFNKTHDHAEMARRFQRFKRSVGHLVDLNNAFVEQSELGEFADGTASEDDDQEKGTPPAGSV